MQAVADAIDRTYTVAPPLNDQRVEMREDYSSGGIRAGTSRGGYAELRDEDEEGHEKGRRKGKEQEREKKRMSAKDEKELNKIFDQIERAHGNSQYLLSPGSLAC